jgi:hypothetical protein
MSWTAIIPTLDLICREGRRTTQYAFDVILLIVKAAGDVEGGKGDDGTRLPVCTGSLAGPVDYRHGDEAWADSLPLRGTGTTYRGIARHRIEDLRQIVNAVAIRIAGCRVDAVVNRVRYMLRVAAPELDAVRPSIPGGIACGRVRVDGAVCALPLVSEHLVDVFVLVTRATRSAAH